MLGKLSNTSPEGSVRPGIGTMTDGRSEWAGPGNSKEALSGGDGVVGHDEMIRGSLKQGR
jgi:hypothetical protein